MQDSQVTRERELACSCRQTIPSDYQSKSRVSLRPWTFVGFTDRTYVRVRLISPKDTVREGSECKSEAGNRGFSFAIIRPSQSVINNQVTRKEAHPNLYLTLPNHRRVPFHDIHTNRKLPFFKRDKNLDLRDREERREGKGESSSRIASPEMRVLRAASSAGIRPRVYRPLY